MKQNITQFIDIVRESKVLNAEQKRELLDNPALLPETYRERIAEILTNYNDRARAREMQLGSRVNDATKRFEQALDEVGVAPEEKQQLLEKLRQHTATLTMAAPAS
jgi:hypothetical protein